MDEQLITSVCERSRMRHLLVWVKLANSRPIGLIGVMVITGFMIALNSSVATGRTSSIVFAIQSASREPINEPQYSQATDNKNSSVFRSIMELLYFGSGVVIALISTFALYQIVLAKRSINTANKNLEFAAKALDLTRLDIDIRCKREAVTLAAQTCEKFAKDILPDCAQRIEKMAEAGVPIRQWNLENNLFDETSLKEWGLANEWVKQLESNKQEPVAIANLNHLESFAMYFAKGAADEQVAYTAVGTMFCHYVNQLAPYLILLRTKETNVASGPFQNIVTLYDCWSTRMEREALESEQSRISSVLSGIHTSDIPPIGPKTHRQTD